MAQKNCNNKCIKNIFGYRKKFRKIKFNHFIQFTFKINVQTINYSSMNN